MKNKKRDEEGNANETNVIEDIIVMVSEIHIDMITEVHIVVIANSLDWWFDSGATVHRCDGACVTMRNNSILIKSFP